MQGEHFKVETIRKMERYGIRYTVSWIDRIPLNTFDGLRGYNLTNVRIESYQRVNGTSDFFIGCDLETPKRVEARYKRIVFTEKNRSSGTDQFLYIGPECQFPDKTRAKLRPVVLQVLGNVIKCLDITPKSTKH